MDLKIEKILSKRITSSISVDILEKYNDFINPELKAVLKAECLRQYIEGAVDLLIKDEILQSGFISAKNWENSDLFNKIQLIGKYYDKEIEFIFDKLKEIGTIDSQYRIEINPLELLEGIGIATYMIERILNKYFKKNHVGSQTAILTMLSSLPLKSRIYILEELIHEGQNNTLVSDVLSMTYLEGGDYLKALAFLAEQKNTKVITAIQYTELVKRINMRYQSLDRGKITQDIMDLESIFNKVIRSYDYSRYKEFTNIFLVLLSGYYMLY